LIEPVRKFFFLPLATGSAVMGSIPSILSKRNLVRWDYSDTCAWVFDMSGNQKNVFSLYPLRFYVMYPD